MSTSNTVISDAYKGLFINKIFTKDITTIQMEKSGKNDFLIAEGYWSQIICVPASSHCQIHPSRDNLLLIFRASYKEVLLWEKKKTKKKKRDK